MRAVTRHDRISVARRARAGLAALGLSLAVTASAFAGAAETPPVGGWQADIDVKKSAPAKQPKQPAKAAPTNTTVIERSGEAQTAGSAQLKLVALLTVDGQRIDQGLIWRVYQQSPDAAGKRKLVSELRDASPALKLEPGDYTINAAFGRANLTRKISVKAGASETEQFVLNAGGLRLNASVTGKPAPAGSVTYAIYSDDREQLSDRALVMGGAKPGLIIRLNAGIYHVVSTYGDANAKVEADVTVEAGKLSEAAVAHQAAKAAFKLVNRAGGEALPETHWTIQTQTGELVKESVGALPSHVLAPGDYQVVAKSGGRLFKKPFSIKDGEMASIEILTDDGVAADSAAAAGDPAGSLEGINPSLEIKNP